MIKLKKILKESKYAWDRKFGEPLPTLKDTMEKHTGRTLSEKKELGGALINKIEQLTDRNAHTEARMTLAKEVDKNLWKAYEGLNAAQNYLRRANETNIVRNVLDKKLFAYAKKKFSDYYSIERAF